MKKFKAFMSKYSYQIILTLGIIVTLGTVTGLYLSFSKNRTEGKIVHSYNYAANPDSTQVDSLENDSITKSIMKTDSLAKADRDYPSND